MSLYHKILARVAIITSSEANNILLDVIIIIIKYKRIPHWLAC